MAPNNFDQEISLLPVVEPLLSLTTYFELSDIECKNSGAVGALDVSIRVTRIL